jgi:HK97 family phage major capsid protein
MTRNEINELYTKRAKAWEAAKAFLDSHENGVLSAEDEQTYNRMEKEVTDLTTAIKRAENVLAMDAQMSMPTSTPIVTKPTAAEDRKTGRASKQYASDMLDAIRTNFRKVSNVLEEGTDANGGYLVPDEWDARLIEKLESENVVRALGTKIVTTGEHKINVVASTPAALWVAEGGALTWGDETFAQKILDAHKLHVAVKVTEELLYDNAYNLEAHLIDMFGKALANAEEDAFLNGNGSGKPTGIFDATNGGEASTVTVSGSLKSDDVIGLVYDLKRPYRKNAAFIMNDKTIAAVRKLKDGNQAYIWQPSYQAGEPDRLLGYAVNTSAYAPETGIAFGDFSYYNIGDRGVRSIQQLRELFAGNGMIGYVMKERVDGILVLREAVKVLTIGS